MGARDAGFAAPHGRIDREYCCQLMSRSFAWSCAPTNPAGGLC